MWTTLVLGLRSSKCTPGFRGFVGSISPETKKTVLSMTEGAVIKMKRHVVDLHNVENVILTQHSCGWPRFASTLLRFVNEMIKASLLDLKDHDLFIDGNRGVLHHTNQIFPRLNEEMIHIVFKLHHRILPIKGPNGVGMLNSMRARVG